MFPPKPALLPPPFTAAPPLPAAPALAPPVPAPLIPAAPGSHMPEPGSLEQAVEPAASSNIGKKSERPRERLAKTEKGASDQASDMSLSATWPESPQSFNST
jgi:hypothetical protein